MQELDLSAWKLRVDPARTRALYESLPPLSCDCGNCREFIAAYDQLPDAVLDVFDKLGIDPRRDGGEVYSYVHHDDESTMYGGVMIFVGEIVTEPSPGFVQGSGFNETQFTDTLAGGFMPDHSLVRMTVPEPPEPHAVFQFTLDRVPSVLGRKGGA